MANTSETSFQVVLVSTGTITGGDANDFLIAATGANATLEGGWGNDILVGNTGDDLLDAGRISLFLMPDDNFLYGGDGNDRLLGAFGNDTLFGATGNDALVPSGGTNSLWGGAGADQFIFGHGAPATGFRQIGQDTIVDFERGDHIDLSRMNYLGGEDDLSYSFIGSAAFSGTGPEVRVTQADGNTYIELDSQFVSWEKVDGVADGRITLQGSHDLTVADFIL